MEVVAGDKAPWDQDNQVSYLHRHRQAADNQGTVPYTDSRWLAGRIELNQVCCRSLATLPSLLVVVLVVLYMQCSRDGHMQAIDAPR
jgi:hypothetical protein